MKKITFLIFLIFAVFQATFAQTGFKLDNTFGINGHAIFAQEDVDIFSNSLLQFKLNEGYIIAGGYEDNLLLESGFIFIRYDKNGKIDTSFGEKGALRYPVVDAPFESIASIKDAADKSCLILLKGTNEMDSDTSGIVCFTAKGKWVTDFGEGGTLFSKNGVIQDFDILSDSKILALISSFDGLPTASFERFTQLGLPDKSYGKDGVAKFNTGFQLFNKMEKNGTSYLCTGIEVDLATSSFNICSAKVSPAGAKAFNYGALGIGKTAPTSKSGGINFPFKSKSLADGSLIILGLHIPDDTTGTEVPTYFLTKINPNGTANTTFGTDGYLDIILEEATELLGVDFLELSNKKILLSKSIFDQAQEVLVTTLELYGVDGKIDTKFGTKGVSAFDINQELNVVFNLALRTDGKVALGGTVLNASTGLGESFISVIELLNAINTQENSAVSSLALYPNPIKDNAILTYELTEDTNIALELFDMNGKLIQLISPSQNRAVGKQQESLSLDANLPTGTYFLRLNLADKGTKTIKLNKI